MVDPGAAPPPPASPGRKPRRALGCAIAAVLAALVALAAGWLACARLEARWRRSALQELAGLSAEGLGVSPGELAAVTAPPPPVDLVAALGTLPRAQLAALEKGVRRQRDAAQPLPDWGAEEVALQRALSLLDEVARVVRTGPGDGSRWGLQDGTPYDLIQVSPELAAVVALQGALRARAVAAFARSDPALAWGDVERMLALADRVEVAGLQRERLRRALTSQALEAAEQGLRLAGPPGPAVAARLDDRLARLEDPAAWQLGLREHLNITLSLVSDAGRWRQRLELLDQRWPYLPGPPGAAHHAHDLATHIRLLGAAVRASRGPDLAALAELRALDERVQSLDPRLFPLPRGEFSAVVLAFERSLELRARVRLTRAALRLTATGALPPALPADLDLADPLRPGGGPPGWSRWDERHGRLWSAGLDGRDAGGRTPDDLVLELALPPVR